jgi:hypothetical protein
MTDLETRIGDVTLPNPVMTAAGCGGTGRELGRFFDVGRSRAPDGRRPGSPRRPPAC